MERKPGLDLLRAIAILWVMPFHSYLAGYMGGGVLRWSGWMGVDLFFALSGFLIGSQIFSALIARGRIDFVDFYLRRGFRTLPAFLVVLAIYLAWPSLREEPGMMPLWQFLTYTLNLFIDPNRGAFSHAWSLCVEEQFYLLSGMTYGVFTWEGFYGSFCPPLTPGQKWPSASRLLNTLVYSSRHARGLFTQACVNVIGEHPHYAKNGF